MSVSTPGTSWSMVAFEKAALPQSDRGKRVKQRDYLTEGRIPVIDQGQTPIGGYTNDEDFAFSGELPVILFGDHTRAVKLVQHRFAVGADGIKIFRPSEGVRAKFLYYWMKSARLPDRGYGRHYQYLRQLSVPLPPPAFQDEVVAEIEKQFSRLDEAVANVKRVKANLKRYKAAVLKAAVEGRLVPTEAELARRDGRSYETGAQLLQRILEVRRSQWKGKGKHKEPMTGESTEVLVLPEGWAWATVDQLAFVDVGFAFKSNEFESTGIRLLRGENIEPERLRWIDTRYWPKDKLEPYRSLLVEEGDIILAMDRPIVTAGLKLARARRSDLPCLLVQRMSRLRCVETATEGYLYIAMGTGRFERHLVGGQTGTQLPHVSGSSIAAFAVPCPPLAEQHRIFAEVDRRLSLVREVDAEVDANLRRARALQQAILQQAFVPSATNHDQA